MTRNGKFRRRDSRRVGENMQNCAGLWCEDHQRADSSSSQKITNWSEIEKLCETFSLSFLGEPRISLTVATMKLQTILDLFRRLFTRCRESLIICGEAIERKSEKFMWPLCKSPTGKPWIKFEAEFNYQQLGKSSRSLADGGAEGRRFKWQRYLRLHSFTMQKFHCAIHDDLLNVQGY